MAGNEDPKIKPAPVSTTSSKTKGLPALKAPKSGSAKPPSDTQMVVPPLAAKSPVKAPVPEQQVPSQASAEVKPPFAAKPQVEAPRPLEEAGKPPAAESSAQVPAPAKVEATKPIIKPAPLAPAKSKPAEPIVPTAASVVEPAKKVATAVKETVEAVSAPVAAATNAASKTATTTVPATPVFAGLFSNFMLEDTTMDMSANFSGFQDAVTEAQAKAKAAFEKSSSVMSEVTDFAKGNVEAAVESGKIFAEGVQGMGSEFVTESRAAFEKMSGDIKELAAAKSPTDFFKLQSDLVRKNFDTAVAYSSKNSEAMLKLMSDTFAPLSGRMSIAVSKARSVTPTL